MNKEELDNINKVMDYVKPFIAIAVLILIVFSSYGLYKHNELKKEVKESCGYEKSEKVYCICDKDFVSSRPSPGNPYYNGSDDLPLNSLKLPESFEN